MLSKETEYLKMRFAEVLRLMEVMRVGPCSDWSCVPDEACSLSLLGKDTRT